MIDQQQRDLLLREIKTGQQDYEKAAEIYQRLHGRSIHPRYLEKFLKGQRKCNSGKPKQHQPIEMYRCVAEAIAWRREREKREKETQTSEASRIYSNLINKIKQDVKTAPLPA